MFRNTFDQGSRLYNPLRQTLQKSRVQDPAIALAKSRVYDQMGLPSRISKRMRSLSPEEADTITKSTLVTDDRELIATNNLWRVRGKQFTAVNIDVKQGKPVSPEVVFSRFGNTRNGFITSETVYEMKPSHSHRSLNTSFKPSRLYSPTPPSIRYCSPTPIYYTNMPTERSIPRVASPVRVAQNPSFLLNSQKTQANPVKLEQKPHQKVTSPSLKLDRVSTKFKPVKKSNYKYNLFSSLDQAVNSGCGSCGGNEIVAKRKDQYWN